MTTALTSMTGYNSNSIPGLALVGNDADIYEINSVPKWSLGTQLTRLDGSKYRYGSFVSAVTQGKLVSHVVGDVDNAVTDALVNAPSSTYQQATEQPGLYPGAVGSRFVVYTLAGVIKDQFAGGYITTNKDTGYGYIYRIKGNDATSAHYSGKVLIELYDKIQVALDATTDTGLVGSLYQDLYPATPGTDYITMGVTVANMTANSFGWICTRGVCVCLQDSAITAAGDIIQPGLTTAGSIMTAGVGTTTVAALVGQNIVGYALYPGATNSNLSYATIFLQLE